MSEIRFGVNVRAVPSRQEFIRFVRHAEDLGYDVLVAPDHLGGLSPSPPWRLRRRPPSASGCGPTS